MGNTRTRTDAEFMDGQTMGLSAWSWDAWPLVKARIVKTTRNQHGTVYTFADGSKGMVRNGSARLRCHVSSREA